MFPDVGEPRNRCLWIYSTQQAVLILPSFRAFDDILREHAEDLTDSWEANKVPLGRSDEAVAFGNWNFTIGLVRPLRALQDTGATTRQVTVHDAVAFVLGPQGGKVVPSPSPASDSRRFIQSYRREVLPHRFRARKPILSILHDDVFLSVPHRCPASSALE